AAGQIQLENRAISAANKFLFVDSNAMSVRVQTEMIHGRCHPHLEKASRKHRYDLYLLTGNFDDDQHEERQKQFDNYHRALVDHRKPFHTLSGPLQTRIERAIHLVQELQRALENGFTPFDFVQIKSHGLSVS